MNRIMLRAAAVGTAMMLTAAGCKNDTPSAPVDKETPVPVFTGIAALKTYLEGQGETTIDKPIAVRLSDVDLSEQETSIENLFAALADTDKYVDLDLSGCTGLTEWGAYTDADRVVSLVLPDSVAEIAKGTASAGTFASFTSLETLTATGVKTVGNNALRRCAALTSISMPAATAIGDFAFAYNALLKTANLPAATAIRDYAFNLCTALASISLPSAVTIGDGAFNSCSALASVNLPAVATIGKYAFSYNALETADLPAATTIGDYAFRDCASLASINLPAAAAIGESAFSGCAALASISLPAAVTIGNRAFYGCVALESVDLPAAATIEARAFYGCAALASANLPAATAIGTNAFRGCAALESLTLGATPPELGATVFFDAGKNTSEGFTVYVPDEAAKTAIDTSSDWYTALYTDIGDGNFKEVKVK
jgi:hypothetical protein